MKHLVILFLVALACSPRPDRQERIDSAPAERPFVLEISEYRTDRKKSPATGEGPTVVHESVLKLYGRVDRFEGGGPRDVAVFYADSMTYDSRQPYVFRTFMSADTLYYASPTGQNMVDRIGDAAIDSMLSCVFGGPALSVFLSKSGEPDSMVHANERCRSGEYGRLNAPVTLSAFFVRQQATDLTSKDSAGNRWHERRVSPSFSGIGFYPEIDLLYRLIESTNHSVTVAVAADSTIENVRTRMPNGEEVVIVRDRFRVGGSLTIARASRLPHRGEIRIREALTLVRPNASGNVLDREGEYTLRFTLPK
jgi:hypothetical protein